MLRVLVRLEGFLAAQFWIEKEINVPKGITWREAILILLKKLRLGSYKDGKEKNLSSIRKLAIFVLNGKESPLETILNEGDVISIFASFRRINTSSKFDLKSNVLLFNIFLNIHGCFTPNTSSKYSLFVTTIPYISCSENTFHICLGNVFCYNIETII